MMGGISYLLASAIAMFASSSLSSEILYVNSESGKDANPGTQQLPLRTIERAVEVINSSPGYSPSIIKIAPGLYELKKHCLIKNNRPYSVKERLIIEAMVLPDDPDWRAELMPIIVSVEKPRISDDDKHPVEGYGLKVEINHVTIRGLKFLGSPVSKILYYPIFREGKDLDDLVVSKCMFLCDQHVITSNVAVLANGQGLKVDHCVFYRCSNAVVFWNADGDVSKDNAMTYCIVDGGYISGVWLCQTDEDFEFHHNIITNCLYAWMRSEGNKKTYRLHDCIINNFQFYSGTCNETFTLRETGQEILYVENNVTKTGEIQLEKGKGLDFEIPARYMHVVKDTLGYELMAGLFRRTH
jgi:hypothetical protein